MIEEKDSRKNDTEREIYVNNQEKSEKEKRQRIYPPAFSVYYNKLCYWAIDNDKHS